MSPFTALRRLLILLFLVTITAARGKDQTPNTYQQGTITGWSNQVYQKSYARDAASRMGNKKFYDLKSGNRIYQIAGIDHPWRGAVSACGPFDVGQLVDFRIEDGKVYFRRDNAKEQKCDISSERMADDKTDNSSPTQH